MRSSFYSVLKRTTSVPGIASVMAAPRPVHSDTLLPTYTKPTPKTENFKVSANIVLLIVCITSAILLLVLSMGSWVRSLRTWHRPVERSRNTPSIAYRCDILEIIHVEVFSSRTCKHCRLPRVVRLLQPLNMHMGGGLPKQHNFLI
jgi:hypothetical protein